MPDLLANPAGRNRRITVFQKREKHQCLDWSVLAHGDQPSVRLLLFAHGPCSSGDAGKHQSFRLFRLVHSAQLHATLLRALQVLIPQGPDHVHTAGRHVGRDSRLLVRLLRSAKERTVEGLWDLLGRVLDRFSADECGRCITPAGTTPVSSPPLHRREK